MSITNLQQLEMALNITVNCLEIGLPILGIYFIYRTAQRHRARKITKGKIVRSYGLGTALILYGVMAPVTINWLTTTTHGCGGIFL